MDFFANMPGLGLADDGLAPMDEVRITRPDDQRFYADSDRLQSRVCRWVGELSGALVDFMSDLVAPAADAAQMACRLRPGLRGCAAWPILERSAAVRDLFSVNGRPMAAEDTFRCEALAHAPRIGQSSRYFEDGEGAQAFLDI